MSVDELEVKSSRLRIKSRQPNSRSLKSLQNLQNRFLPWQQSTQRARLYRIPKPIQRNGSLLKLSWRSPKKQSSYPSAMSRTADIEVYYCLCFIMSSIFCPKFCLNSLSAFANHCRKLVDPCLATFAPLTTYKS